MDSKVVKDSQYYIGNTAMNKSRMNLPVQAPQEQVEKHQTLMPHSHGRKNGLDIVEQKQPDVKTKPTIGKSQLDVGMHSHFGSPDPHPIRMRHRKGSADPLHKEEDGLLDEWYDLYDKATSGQCTAQELQRIEEIRGRIGEINSSRSTDAERILGIAMKAVNASQGHLAKAGSISEESADDITAGGPGSGPQPGQGRKQPMHALDDQGRVKADWKEKARWGLGLGPSRGHRDKIWQNNGASHAPDKPIWFDEKAKQNWIRQNPLQRAFEIAKAESSKAESLFQVEESDLKDNDASWRDKEAEYGDPVDDLEIIPRNDGYKDQADHSHSIGQTMPKDDRVFSAEPDIVRDAKTVKSALRKAAAVTDNVISYFEKQWGHDNFLGDDGRFSDPLFYDKYMNKAVVNKHDLPGSPHWEHMTNGGGWGVKLNPKTGNFVAYQTETGAMKKREAQQEAVSRNKKNSDEKTSNDKVDADRDIMRMNEQIQQAIKPLDIKPLNKLPRNRP